MTTESYRFGSTTAISRPSHPLDARDTLADELLDRLRHAERRGRIDQVRYYERKLASMGIHFAIIPNVSGEVTRCL